MDRAYCDGFYEVNGGWQLAVFMKLLSHDDGHPMLESAFLYNMQLPNVSPDHAVHTVDSMAWLEEVYLSLRFWALMEGLIWSIHLQQGFIFTFPQQNFFFIRNVVGPVIAL
ncbi:unnamed protein product [Rhizophagus irregularis]|nr:unnamed protein product [Rhizophagus irregularis]